MTRLVGNTSQLTITLVVAREGTEILLEPVEPCLIAKRVIIFVVFIRDIGTLILFAAGLLSKGPGYFRVGA